MAKIYLSTFSSPIGNLMIASNNKGICKLSTTREDEGEVRRWLNGCYPGIPQLVDSAAHEQVIAELKAYFAGQLQQFNVPLDLRGTTFQLTAWQALLDIPYGEVRSYQQQAIALGNSKAVRAVGGANNKNPIAIIVPCHRVIGKNGALVGYGGGLEMKEYLLNLEGVKRP